jgi:hypothetical protein
LAVQSPQDDVEEDNNTLPKQLQVPEQYTYQDQDAKATIQLLFDCLKGANVK